MNRCLARKRSRRWRAIGSVAVFFAFISSGKSLQAGDSKSTPDAAKSRPRIYQLFVRQFGNTNETRKPNGTLSENGVGKINDINDAALDSLRGMGFTHIWLTGILQQATATDYSSAGQPADDPDLLKGIAGSPYAIKDYFDVCPDYAEKPEKRLDEFKDLVRRIHGHGLKALIDLVPNHVARSYNSDIKPELSFGARDNTAVFFAPQNNFFYLKPASDGPPLKLPSYKDGKAVSPTCKTVAALKQGTAVSQPPTKETSAAGKPPLLECDGLFDGEMKFGRVTGNDKASWTPDINDWYETVKLNYGFDFTDTTKATREYPNAKTPDKPIPDTWKKVVAVMQYWQSAGVDGFRCDMSHMVPPEFWSWAIAQVRTKNPDAMFIGEAYENDPAKIPRTDASSSSGKLNVMADLLNAGFSAVYDDPTYRAIKKIYEGPGWANDIDSARPDGLVFENSLRYAENHDEVRLAAKSQWGGLGMKVGLPVSAILYGLSRGPVMMYNGQEVGEPGDAVEGFGGNDARTSIFDYWSMPEFVKWVNDHKYDGGRLSAEQKELRAAYGRLINLVGEPAFRDGIFIPLNAANRDNPNYGRLPNEKPSGHWLYAFLRHDSKLKQTFLIVVNLHSRETLKDVRIIIPATAVASLGWDKSVAEKKIQIQDRLNMGEATSTEATIGGATGSGITLPQIEPLKASYLELKLQP